MTVGTDTDFTKLWTGGYFEGVPTDPLANSSYKHFGFVSTLFATYVGCIKPYVHASVTALEIGPGRGAWSKAIADCGPKLLYAVDAVSAEHSRFWDYVGKRQNVEFHQVGDFDLEPIPDNSVDYFFSFGVFCHLKPEMCVAYINALGRKMKPGAHGFLMVADFDKYNACYNEPYRNSTLAFFAGGGRRMALLRSIIERLVPKGRLVRHFLTKGGYMGEGSWYHLGVDAASAALKDAGFSVLDSDMHVNNRDPVIHFVRD